VLGESRRTEVDCVRCGRSLELPYVGGARLADEALRTTDGEDGAGADMVVVVESDFWRRNEVDDAAKRKTDGCQVR